MRAVPALEHAASRARLTALPPLAAGALVAALDLLFPALCPVCGAPCGPGRRDPLCGACWAGIPRIEPPCCDACGLPLWRPLREALHALKFGGRRALARPLADLLLEQCGAGLPADVTAVVPVPLARDRERARGFNQAGLIAERLARRLGLPLERRWLARVRATAPQSELAAEERRTNVRGAFRAAPDVRGRHVLLVDDVLTTGATLAECARAVAAAGAARVGVLTVARVL